MIYRFFNLLFLLFLLQSCSGNKWLIPEGDSSQKLQDKKIIGKDIFNPLKYEANNSVVRSEVLPGHLLSNSPDPVLHHISKSDQQISKKKFSSEEQQKTTVEKKKTKSHVVYAGNELLRNRGPGKRNGLEEITTIIRGAASVRYEQMLMKSFEIRVLGAEGDNAISEYPVVIYDHKSNTTLKAGYGEFIRLENRAYFKSKPSVTHIDKKSSEKTIITSDEMDRYFSSSITRAYGHVMITYPNATAYGAQVTYYESDDMVLLEGNPVIYEKKNIYKADKMTLYKSQKIAILEGNVRVYLTQEKKESADSREVVTLITSDYAEYRYGSLIKVAEFTSKTKNSFVYVSRKDSDTYCDHMIARGEQLDEMELFNNIYILDKENRTRLFGEYGKYNKQEQRSRVFTRNDADGNAIHPVLIFYNKKDIITGKMTSETLDRDLEKKMTYARGHVEFELYEKKESSEIQPALQNLAHGEWSEMEDQKKIIFVLGHPYLQNNQNKIFAAQIVIYPDENRLELLNSLKGIFSN